MSSWRVATFLAIAGIAVVFQVFFRDTSPHDFASTTNLHSSEAFLSTCKTIRKAISKESSLFYPGSQGYADDVQQWIPDAAENSACSVRPGSVEDVQTIIKILGATTTPFGIKSGGWTFNKGWSSTTGVQIALSKFNEITYDAATNSVKMGLGNRWHDVFGTLEKINITVSGGRIHGVGVGGFILGGGYSYLTDESGLTMDNVISYNIVLPNGTVATASHTSNPELFWGLKGGSNNFGIVTSAVVKAFPLGEVYGGQMIYSGDSLPLLANAIEQYTLMQNGTNPVSKGGLIVAYKFVAGQPPVAIVQLFYNGPTPPDRMMAHFKGIPGDTSSLGVYTFTGLIAVMSPIFQNPENLRAASTTVSVYSITAPIIEEFWDIIGKLDTGFPDSQSAVVMFEPFIPSAIVGPLSDGLFPHEIFASPLNCALWWTDPTEDDAGHKALQQTAKKFTEILRKDGQPVDKMAVYPNYADASHTVKDLYGPNLARGKKLRKQIDPHGVMLRTGGWKLV